MEKLLYIGLIILFIIWIIIEAWILITRDAPPLDEDISEMLLRDGNSYDFKAKDEDGEFIHNATWKGIHIYKQKYSLLFPYWLEGVGVVPFWYKSVPLLNELWNKFPSSKEQSKRNKLSINKALNGKIK